MAALRFYHSHGHRILREHFAPKAPQKLKSAHIERAACISTGGSKLYIIILNGVFFLVSVLILIFSGEWGLAVGFFLPHIFGIRLTVLWHSCASLSLAVGPKGLFPAVVVPVGVLIFERFLTEGSLYFV
ncbi:hypothetical protein ACQRD3_12055 [Candidatus Pseudoscillospira sp. SGI.172]